MDDVLQTFARTFRYCVTHGYHILEWTDVLRIRFLKRKIKFEFQKELNDKNIRAASYTF